MRSPTIKEIATTAPITMPEIAPEARPEEGFDAPGLVDGLDTGKNEDVVAGALD